MAGLEWASSRMSPESVAERASREHGEAKALRLATLEQQKARRARSRKAFDFWAAVAAQLAAGSIGRADGGPPSRTPVGGEHG